MAKWFNKNYVRKSRVLHYYLDSCSSHICMYNAFNLLVCELKGVQRVVTTEKYDNLPKLHTLFFNFYFIFVKKMWKIFKQIQKCNEYLLKCSLLQLSMHYFLAHHYQLQSSSLFIIYLNIINNSTVFSCFSVRFFFSFVH